MAERLRFHLDENVNPAIAAGLRQRGIDVTTTQETGLLQAADDDQLAFATRQQRVLVTHDRDFLRPGFEPHAGIAFCARDKYAIGGLIRALLTLWSSVTAEEMVNRVVFL
jgi:hypothetical protein